MRYLTIKKGKLDQLSAEAITSLPDGEYILSKRTKKRSNEQNKYLHGAVLPKIKQFFADMGYDYSEVDIKDWLKARGFFGHKSFGKELIPCHTSELSTLDFMAAIEKIQRYFAEKGLDIPSPNEEDYRIGETK